MQTSDSRKEILDRIKSSLRGRGEKSLGVSHAPKVDSSEFLDPLDDMLEFVFARNFVEVNGKFSFCENQKELIAALIMLYKEKRWENVYVPEAEIRQYLKMAGIPCHHDSENIESIQAGVTGCEYLIARSGSILVSSSQTMSRRVIAHSPQHIVIARTSQIVDEMKHGLEGIRNKYEKLPGTITAITGPSRTADIEKTLVLGAHGPEELYVFLVNDN